MNEKEYTYTASERETIIRFSDADDIANVESFNESMKRKLLKLVDEYPESVQFVPNWEKRKKYGGVAVVMPKSWIKIRTPMKLTDEQRKVMADSLRDRLNTSKANSLV